MEKIKYPIKIGNMFKLSFSEEVGNVLSHGVMALFCLIMLPIVSVLAYVRYGVIMAVGYSIYCIGIFFMFLMSTLYHAMKFETSQKKVFRVLDHCSIYVAIAATFTPVCLLILDGFYLWLILILQWSLVLFGIIYKSLTTNRKVKSGVLMYLFMGWSAAFLIPKLLSTQSSYFFLFIILGGIFYSVGIFFYAKKTKAWFHFIWHIFVNLAAISHFIAVVFLAR